MVVVVTFLTKCYKMGNNTDYYFNVSKELVQPSGSDGTV